MESIDETIALLENLEQRAAGTPAMLYPITDHGNFLVGNAEGFIKFALAALKAAKGEPQSFKDASWIGGDDLDWEIGGMRLDSSAHLYLPKRPTLWQRIFSAAVGLFLVVCLLVGLVTIGLAVAQVLH